MTLLIDLPLWPRHGRIWGHLVSDSSLDELHAFARLIGIPERGFDLDHYDVPEDMHVRLLAAGAQLVDGRELVRRLRASGLRVTASERRRSKAPRLRGSATPPLRHSATPPLRHSEPIP